MKLASPSKPSCIKVSIPLIAMIIAQVGILIEAFGSGGTQKIQIALHLNNSCREEDPPLEV